MTGGLPARYTPHGLRRCLGASFLINQAFFAELQRFPLEHADPIDIFAGQLEPIRQAFRWVIGCRLPPGLPLVHFAPQHFPEQLLFVPKIMIQHALIDRCAAGNLVHARAGKSLRREFNESGFEDPFLRALRIPRAWCGQRADSALESSFQVAATISFAK